MKKTIVIAGAGLSGLALLHYLQKKYSSRSDFRILLLEKSARGGGAIESVSEDGYLFETGPNGFLDSKPQTLELVKDLELEDQLITAKEKSKIRYIAFENKLYPMPVSPQSLLLTPLLRPLEKLRIFREPFLSKGNNPKESVFDFGKRRFGQRVAEIFFDPMVRGIYGGNSTELNLKEAFPWIYQLEQQHGSLIRAQLKLKKKSTDILRSLKGGMGQLTNALTLSHRNQIFFNQEIKFIEFKENQYRIKTSHQTLQADELYLTVPAYISSALTQNFNPVLAGLLLKINYAPIAVAGFAFKKDSQNNLPEGFGYLIPSWDRTDILGVVFESQIFPQRAPEGHFVVRVMMRADNQSKECLIEQALYELKMTLKISTPPIKTFFTHWPKAIPQYDQTYAQNLSALEKEISKHPALHLSGNYYKGVGVNDCIENAYKLAMGAR